MARTPFVSINCGIVPFPTGARESWAVVQTNPSKVGFIVASVGSLKFQSTWLSFHDGLGFSTHMVCRWNEVTGCVGSHMQSGEVLAGEVKGSAGLQPGFEAAGPCSGAMPDAGLNCGNPSNF
jgi:hypothetical protein